MMKKGSNELDKSKSRFAPREYKETMTPRMNINNKSFTSSKSIPMANSPSSNIRREESSIRRDESKSFSGPRRTTIIRTVDPRSSANAKIRSHFKVKASNFNDFNYSSNLTRFELHRLAKRFAKLDADNSGSITLEEFMNLTELQDNHLVQRVISLFDQVKNGEVDFKEFIDGISVFSLKSEREAKLRFAFRIYDMDNDGYISNVDLFTVLQIMVGDNLKDNQLQEIVDRTILYADADEDGKLSFKEFCKSIGNASDVDKTILDIVVDV